jgi:hypothetical protein
LVCTTPVWLKQKPPKHFPSRRILRVITLLASLTWLEDLIQFTTALFFRNVAILYQAVPENMDDIHHNFINPMKKKKLTSIIRRYHNFTLGSKTEG